MAFAAPGGSTGDDQLQIMAPAAPGGGWGTTARAFESSARDAKLDDGIEAW